jgi:pilus assembly protein CpaE
LLQANGANGYHVEGKNGFSPDLTRMLPPLTAILVCPDDYGRRGLASALSAHKITVREYADYPAPGSLKPEELNVDVALVDLDADQDLALAVIRNICESSPAVTVMACSRRQDPELLMLCMRSGAREFIPEPPVKQVLSEALDRASARRIEEVRKKTTGGKILVFWGAKGGAGVTTLATNFAISLKQESGGEVALLDLHVQLGDVAVLLGIRPEFTIIDAFKSGDRLDRDLVKSVMTSHKSGLSVLAAPDDYKPIASFHSSSIGKLLYLLREQFPYIVVDAGTGVGGSCDAVFGLADNIYLVSQVDIPSLRNTQRIYSYLEGAGAEKVQVVLNRFDPRKDEIEEDRITKALGIGPKWKVPGDYQGVRRSQNLGEPLAGGNSPISRTILEMARAACGKAPLTEGKRKFSLFR